jgi:cardiolipin synthase A/B
MSHRLIILPDDTADAIIDPINAACHSLNIRMFLFTDPTLLNAVIAAKRRGVHVRVMLTRPGATAPATMMSHARRYKRPALR